jgi:hypothetical protein
VAGGPIGNAPHGVLVPTILRTTDDFVAYWTSMTCLYDPYWRPATSKVTLPVCMFHMTGITETWSNETSKKRVILYEEPPTVEQASKPMRRGVMETIIDNIVKNPKTYSLELIVPFLPIGRYIGDGVKAMTDTVAAIAELAGSGDPAVRDTIIAALDSSLGFASGVLGAAKTVTGLLDRLPSTGSGSAMTLNKNSLEAMAESGRVLCMKMWHGYDYRYVVITGMTVQKRPIEDEVFRATLQLVELPVLAIAEPTDLEDAVTKKLSVAEDIVHGTFNLISTPLMGFMGVDDKDAGGPLGGK